MRVQAGRPVGYRAEVDQPPPRPSHLGELPFTPLQPVRWFSPFVLAAAGAQALMSFAFGSYLDKRELQTVLDQEPFTELGDRDEAWVDYVADTGDGFDATYTVASLVGQAQLGVDGLAELLPRADLLVLGGDQVYPDATAGGYEDRLEGPFTAALPWTPPGRRPAMFAIPGNHDWYDGLTSFMRVFGQQKAIGGWQTYQTRSYYAVKLPHHWWLLGMDVQFDTYIDEPQLRFFEGLDIGQGDRVILCTAEPSWVDAPADPTAYRNLAYFERKILAPKGAEVALALAGDLHHYARYQESGGWTQKITAGGGGAFLHPTHGLPRQISVRTDPDDADTEKIYDLACTYPTTRRSRRLALGTLALPLRNVSFVLLPGLLYVLLTADLLRTLRSQAAATVGSGPSATTAELRAALDMIRGATPVDTLAGIFASPTSLVILILVLLALAGFAKPARRIRPRLATWAKRGMSLVHTVMHVVAVALVAWVTLGVASLAPAEWPLTGIAYVLALLLGAVVGSLVFALYLTLANAVWAAEGNHAFSAQRLSGYKNFLRLHIGDDGALDVHAIGIDRACHAWTAAPEDARDDAAWVIPTGHRPMPRLIDHVTLAPKRIRPPAPSRASDV